MRVIKDIQNKLAQKFDQLDLLTDLSALSDQAVMLNEYAYLLAACHNNVTFRYVIIDMGRHQIVG